MSCSAVSQPSLPTHTTVLGARPRGLSNLQDVLVFCRHCERALCNLARYLDELAGVRVPFSRQNDGQAVVASMAYLRVQFDGTQECQVGLLGQTLRAAPGKDVDHLVAVRAGELA